MPGTGRGREKVAEALHHGELKMMIGGKRAASVDGGAGGRRREDVEKAQHVKDEEDRVQVRIPLKSIAGKTVRIIYGVGRHLHSAKDASASQRCSRIESRGLGRRVKDYSCRHQGSDDANDEAMCPHIDANWTDYEEDSLVLKMGGLGEARKKRRLKLEEKAAELIRMRIDADVNAQTDLSGLEGEASPVGREEMRRPKQAN
ncbi:hypothetical protein ALC57_17629 [Trachymyrmex cornetzi]|uniref:Uncharacterized protein n=1 Tax=Trachymyrmex cornetzi TaxID=471704 RepID=A0A151ITS7_9HYME|nr:hypothetical protein ALC57_17629 [Trachymyrmex cornetzi]